MRNALLRDCCDHSIQPRPQSQHMRTHAEQKQVELWWLFLLCTFFSPREPRSMNVAPSPSKGLRPGPSSRHKHTASFYTAKCSPDHSVPEGLGKADACATEGRACKDSHLRPEVPFVPAPRLQQPGMQVGQMRTLGPEPVTHCRTNRKAVHLPRARPGLPTDTIASGARVQAVLFLALSLSC